jgi:hypothetical protein
MHLLGNAAEPVERTVTRPKRMPFPWQFRIAGSGWTPSEVEGMIVSARRAGGRLAERDALSIMIAYRLGTNRPALGADRSSGLRNGWVEGEPCLGLTT